MPISLVENRDCMQAMSEFPDKYFDLAVVDPEYGINAGNMTMGKGSRNDTGKNQRKDWDKKPPAEEYFKELFRVSKNQIIWGGNYFLDKIGKPTRCFLIWDKIDYNSDFASAELAWTSFDAVVKTFQRARNCGDEEKIHPTQKPIKLYDWIFKNYAKEGMKILDTHLGSGSSRISAHKAGLDFWGYELDKDYFEAQEARYKNYLSQLDLFREAI